MSRVQKWPGLYFSPNKKLCLSGALNVNMNATDIPRNVLANPEDITLNVLEVPHESHELNLLNEFHPLDHNDESYFFQQIGRAHV